MRNWKFIAFFAAMLTFFMVVWARVSVVIFALFASHDYPTLQAMLGQIISAENLEFLLVWGVLIVAIIGASLLVFMPLLIVTAPWVGHATWHAYKGMIGAHQEAFSPSLA